LKCFVIGNGESRKEFDLTKLLLNPRENFPVYGCNALYRDFIPDILFISDQRMIEETNPLNINIAKVEGHIVKFNDGTILCLPNSFKVTGIMALLCAPLLNIEIEDFYLVGFDMYPSEETGKLNNLYKDSLNYRKSDECYRQMVSHSVPALKFVFKLYGNKNFIMVNDKKSQYFNECKNLYHISYNEFNKVLKYGRE